MKKLAIGLFAAITAALMVWGFYQAIYVAPDDATCRGTFFASIYYHVPSALAFLFFAICLAGSIGYLTFRRNRPEWAQISDAWALAGAEVGVVFCTVVLITGPHLGTPRLGHLVDMGRTPDHYAGPVAHLRQLPAVAPLCRRAAGANASRRSGHLWRSRRAHRLHVEPLVAHPASCARLGGAPDSGIMARWPAFPGTCWPGSPGAS